MNHIVGGNRIISPRDLVQHFGSTESWWEKMRPRMIRAGLLTKAGRRFIGDLARIEAAIADPGFWAEPEAAPERRAPEPEGAPSREPA